MFRYLFLLLALLLSPLAMAGTIDINAASASELEALPGIGPTKAQAIVEFRESNGPFQNVEALDDVPGIGPATLASIRDMVLIGTGKAPATAVPAPVTTPNPVTIPDPESADMAAPDTPTDPVAATPPGASGLLNINTATAEELDALPGIGASKAAAIVDDRNTNGPFASCNDLSRVSGIGPATVANIEGLCTVK